MERNDVFSTAITVSESVAPKLIDNYLSNPYILYITMFVCLYLIQIHISEPI